MRPWIQTSVTHTHTHTHTHNSLTNYHSQEEPKGTCWLNVMWDPIG
jgi:hypothetical protein